MHQMYFKPSNKQEKEEIEVRVNNVTINNQQETNIKKLHKKMQMRNKPSHWGPSLGGGGQPMGNQAVEPNYGTDSWGTGDQWMEVQPMGDQHMGNHDPMGDQALPMGNEAMEPSCGTNPWKVLATLKTFTLLINYK